VKPAGQHASILDRGPFCASTRKVAWNASSASLVLAQHVATNSQKPSAVSHDQMLECLLRLKFRPRPSSARASFRPRVPRQADHVLLNLPLYECTGHPSLLLLLPSPQVSEPCPPPNTELHDLVSRWNDPLQRVSEPMTPVEKELNPSEEDASGRRLRNKDRIRRDRGDFPSSPA